MKPQLSYCSGSPFLSDRAAYPYFSRVLNADSDLDIYVALCRRYNWTRVAVMYEDLPEGISAAGLSGFSALTQLQADLARSLISKLRDASICVDEIVAPLAVDSELDGGLELDEETANNAMERLERSPSRILFLSFQTDLPVLLHEFQAREEVGNYQIMWIEPIKVLPTDTV